MNLYDKASLIITPNAYKAGKIYAAKPTSGAGDLTFARNSVAYMNNALGVLEQVAINTPRLNYNTIGGCPALLIEPARTNLVLNSNNLAATSYMLDNVTLSGNTVTETTSNSSHSINTTFQGTYAINTLHTYSFLVKRGTGTRNVRIGVSNGVDGDLNCLLNLTTGLVSDLGASGSWSNISARATLQANGTTYLFEVTGQSSVGASRRITCFIVNGSSGFYTGDGVSSIEVQHIQGEVGTYATSRILTTSSTVTRVGDAVFSSNATSFIGQDAGTIVVNYRPYAFGLSLGRIVVSTDGSLNNRIWLGYNTNNTITCFIRNTSGVIFNVNPATLQVNGLNKIAIAYANGDIRIYLNGVLITSSSAAMVFAQPRNNFYIGSSEASNDVNQIYIDSCYVYMSALSNSECINLTT